MENIKRKTQTWAIGLTKQEIRQLLWWATIGIARSKGGSYDTTAPVLIKELAKELKILLPYKPEFNTMIKKYYRKKRRINGIK